MIDENDWYGIRVYLLFDSSSRLDIGWMFFFSFFSCCYCTHMVRRVASDDYILDRRVGAREDAGSAWVSHVFTSVQLLPVLPCSRDEAQHETGQAAREGGGDVFSIESVGCARATIRLLSIAHRAVSERAVLSSTVCICCFAHFFHISE